MQNTRANSSADVTGEQERATSIPDPGSETIKISEWKVDTAARQKASIKAIAEAWKHAPWPGALQSYHVHASYDGTTLLHYSQWGTEGGFNDFVANHRDSRVALIDAAVPGITRYGLGSFDLYRSHYADTTVSAGCIVAVRADADSNALQHEWIDAVVQALESDQIPGLRAAHFHVCDDDKRIFNYAEWESEEAHIRAMQNGKGISQTDSAAWQAVQTMPGITQRGFRRYALPRKIEGATPTIRRGGEHA